MDITVQDFQASTWAPTLSIWAFFRIISDICLCNTNSWSCKLRWVPIPNLFLGSCSGSMKMSILTRMIWIKMLFVCHSDIASKVKGFHADLSELMMCNSCKKFSRPWEWGIMILGLQRPRAQGEGGYKPNSQDHGLSLPKSILQKSSIIACPFVTHPLVDIVHEYTR